MLRGPLAPIRLPRIPISIAWKLGFSAIAVRVVRQCHWGLKTAPIYRKTTTEESIHESHLPKMPVRESG